MLFMFSLVASKIVTFSWYLEQKISKIPANFNKERLPIIPILMFPLVFLMIFSGPLYAQNGPSGSYTEAALDDSLIRNAVGNILRLLEGAFGALIMVIAGILAIISAAMGGYRNAISMLVVALGAFILRALISLFFGTDFEAFQN